MNQELEKILMELNLRESEIKVYLFLLDFGKSSVGDISKKTGIHRRNVYDCLDRLIKKGFVRYIKENKIKNYSLINPKNILEKLDEKKKNYEKILPEILNKYNSISEKSQTLFFTGKEGLKQMFQEQIDEGKEILIYGSSVNIKEILKYFFEGFDLKRKEKSIKIRIIYDAKLKENTQIRTQIEKIPLSKIKFLNNFNSTNVSEYIYGDNYAIVVWQEIPIGIIIKQVEIAQMKKEKFNLLWKLK